MNFRLLWTVPFVLGASATLTSAQNLGSAPSFTLNVADVYTAFHLPPLKDTSDGGLVSVLSSTQVGTRAGILSLNGQSPVNAWSSAQSFLQASPSLQPRVGRPTVVFSGATASALNKLLLAERTSVVITAPQLMLDQPIEVQQGGITLDFGHTLLNAGVAQPYMLRVEGTSNVTVRGGVFAFGEAGILVSNSQQVRVEDVELHDLSSDGIVVTGSTQVRISGNRIHGVSGAAIMVHRGTSMSAVERNDISNNLGQSNVTAGIVISDREVNLAANPLAIFGPDGYWVVTQPITSRLNPPHDNAIVFNHISRNASSGIYSDGGVRNVILSNTIMGNAKEGLCLDNGSTANVVAANVVEQNGDRWGEPDWVLTEDQVIAGGRLPDGTAAEKVPGISLDNAMYNIVFENVVDHNFGGGIKIVRTGYFNSIGLNTTFSDNDGASQSFHFFGIELGAAPGQSSELDFTPSRGNIVFSNPIRGSHYSGIFFDSGSDLNDVFDNTIMDALSWALESVAVMANNSLNNLTNLPSRNIGSGLDPALLTIGQPVLDSGGQ